MPLRPEQLQANLNILIAGLARSDTTDHCIALALLGVGPGNDVFAPNTGGIDDQLADMEDINRIRLGTVIH